MVLCDEAIGYADIAYVRAKIILVLACRHTFNDIMILSTKKGYNKMRTITDNITESTYTFIDGDDLKNLLASIFDTSCEGIAQAIDDICEKVNHGENTTAEETFLNVTVGRTSDPFDPKQPQIMYNPDFLFEHYGIESFEDLFDEAAEDNADEYDEDKFIDYVLGSLNHDLNKVGLNLDSNGVAWKNRGMDVIEDEVYKAVDENSIDNDLYIILDKCLKH